MWQVCDELLNVTVCFEGLLCIYFKLRKNNYDESSHNTHLEALL